MKKAILLILPLLFGLLGVAHGENYVIGPEDVLQVSVWGSPELSVQQLPVRPDGMISVPLVGDVKVDGMTPDQLKEYLEKEYLKYIKAPNVSVIVTAINSFKVFVVGGGVSTGSGGSSSGAIILKKQYNSAPASGTDWLAPGSRPEKRVCFESRTKDAGQFHEIDK